jgi:hypothetical protein
MWIPRQKRFKRAGVVKEASLEKVGSVLSFERWAGFGGRKGAF